MKVFGRTTFAGCDTMNDILALKEKFDQESTAEGLDHLYEIVTNGWTIDSPNAMAHDDARKMFMSGKAAMYPTGTREVSTFGSKEEGLGDDCGFFFLPFQGLHGPFLVRDNLVFRLKALERLVVKHCVEESGS